MSLFTWVIWDGIDPPSLLLSLIQTQAILENFSWDLKLAKISLLNSAQLSQFPDSEWSNLISGQAIDLDHVLAGQYSVAHNDRQKVKIIVGLARPVRTVNLHGWWVIAWDQAVNVTTYVFPHWSSKLQEYGRHMSQLFASFPNSLHSCIIQYDCAICICIAQWQDLLLTDYSKFSNFHVLWIQNAGGGSHKAGEGEKRNHSGGTSGAGNKCREACKRWNGGHCPNTVSNCNFIHVCTKC